MDQREKGQYESLDAYLERLGLASTLSPVPLHDQPLAIHRLPRSGQSHLVGSLALGNRNHSLILRITLDSRSFTRVFKCRTDGRARCGSFRPGVPPNRHGCIAQPPRGKHVWNERCFPAKRLDPCDHFGRFMSAFSVGVVVMTDRHGSSGTPIFQLDLESSSLEQR